MGIVLIGGPREGGTYTNQPIVAQDVGKRVDGISSAVFSAVERSGETERNSDTVRRGGGGGGGETR